MGPDPALATAPIQGGLGQNYVSKKKKKKKATMELILPFSGT